MGAFFSRQNAGVEEVDIGASHAYRYPPKQGGHYFSTHFIMGGERFDTALPEMYLFGENTDLNFLGSRPAPFPYPAPSASEPSKTLKALINIRKESLRFVKVAEETSSLKDSEPVETGVKNVQPPRSSPTGGTGDLSAPPASPPHEGPSFNIEFIFDCDVRCAITIMYFCTEESTSQGLVYVPRDPSMNSETYHYKRGANQQFSQTNHVFCPSQHAESDLVHSFERDLFPVVVHCVAEEGDEPRQSQATIAIGVVEKHSDGFVLKALKQKLFVHGLCYLLQEIYGIENKNSEVQKNGDDEGEDNGAECVICMCDLRDTLILPCRHLCLCNCCADSLRYQANNCPICRAPFRALLQIKALQKSGSGLPNPHSSAQDNSDIPAGYEAVSLIEALNGPSVAGPVQPPAPTNNDLYVRLPQHPAGGHRSSNPEPAAATGGNLEDSTTQTDNTGGGTGGGSLDSSQQMRMSVLLAAENTSDKLVVGEPYYSSSEAAKAVSSPGNTSGAEGGSRRKTSGSRRRLRYDSQMIPVNDTVKMINEIKQQPGESSGLLQRSMEEQQRDAGSTEAGGPAYTAATVSPATERSQRGQQAVLESDEESDSYFCDEPPKRKKVDRVLSYDDKEGGEDGNKGERSAAASQYPSHRSAKSHPLQPPSADTDDDEEDGLSVHSAHSLSSVEPGAINPLHAAAASSSATHSWTSDDRSAADETRKGGSWQPSSGSVAKQTKHRKQQRLSTEAADADSEQRCPSGVEQPSLPSMPGTPLSNGSDVSSTSAGSSQALLQQQQQGQVAPAPRATLL